MKYECRSVTFGSNNNAIGRYGRVIPLLIVGLFIILAATFLQESIIYATVDRSEGSTIPIPPPNRPTPGLVDGTTLKNTKLTIEPTTLLEDTNEISETEPSFMIRYSVEFIIVIATGIVFILILLLYRQRNYNR